MSLNSKDSLVHTAMAREVHSQAASVPKAWVMAAVSGVSTAWSTKQ